MTDIPIPDDLIDITFPIAVSLAGNVTDNLEASLVQLAAEHQITQAIMRDRAAQAERMARMEEAVSFVARWAWRTDPPNATGHLTDTDRLSCIKHHPTIKNAAQPHIELAEAEAARALSQEGSDA